MLEYRTGTILREHLQEDRIVKSSCACAQVPWFSGTVLLEVLYQDTRTRVHSWIECGSVGIEDRMPHAQLSHPLLTQRLHGVSERWALTHATSHCYVNEFIFHQGERAPGPHFSMRTSNDAHSRVNPHEEPMPSRASLQPTKNKAFRWQRPPADDGWYPAPWQHHRCSDCTRRRPGPSRSCCTSRCPCTRASRNPDG